MSRKFFYHYHIGFSRAITFRSCSKMIKIWFFTFFSIFEWAQSSFSEIFLQVEACFIKNKNSPGYLGAVIPKVPSLFWPIPPLTQYGKMWLKKATFWPEFGPNLRLFKVCYCCFFYGIWLLKCVNELLADTNTKSKRNPISGF